MSHAKIGSGREDECVSESAWYTVRSVSGVVCRNTKRRSCRSILTTSVMTAASRRGRRKNRTTTTKQRNCRVRASGRWCRATDVDVAATQSSCSPSRPRNGRLWCSRAEEKWTTSVECDKDESTNMKILKVFLSHYWPNNDKCVLSLLSRLSTSAAERRRPQPSINICRWPLSIDGTKTDARPLHSTCCAYTMWAASVMMNYISLCSARSKEMPNLIPHP